MQGVVHENGGVGHYHPFHRGMADIALMPQRLILKGRKGVARAAGGPRPHRFSAEMGLRLWGMAGGAFLAFGEAFLHFMHFGALKMAQFGTQTLYAASGDGKRGKVVSVAIPAE